MQEKSMKDLEQSANDGCPNAIQAEKSLLPQSEFTVRSCATIVGAFAIFFVSIGFVNSFGVFQEYYSEHILSNRSASDISWVGSFNVFCLFGGSFVTGMLNDIYGPTVLLYIGSFITVLAMFMTSICNEYYQIFLAQGFLLGIGISFLFCPAMATVPLYFKANRGLALGIIVSGSSLGGVIWPIALKMLFTEVGFGWTVRIAGFMMLALTGLACLTIRPPMLSAGTTCSRRKSLDTSVFKQPILIIISISLCFIYTGLFSPFFYITPYTASLGLDSNMAFYMISILNAASLFGRILPGILADWYGPLNMFIFAIASSFVIEFCWTKATSIAGIIIFSLAYGFFSGAVVSLMGACAIQSVEPAQFGSAIGFAMSILSIGALVGPPINGQLLDKYGYLALSMFSGAVLVVGTLGFIAARLRIKRKILAEA